MQFYIAVIKACYVVNYLVNTTKPCLFDTTKKPNLESGYILSFKRRNYFIFGKVFNIGCLLICKELKPEEDEQAQDID
ncbi:hypothetical protein HI914_02265 [Erysiphe necator]|nr:hypothetical protein HI914_02265 [Erysiphe necator]